MKTIVAAVDFSEASDKVIAEAAAQAGAFGAKLVLLHVVEPIASYVPVGAAMDVIETAPPALTEQDLAAQHAQLERLAAPYESAEVTAVIGLAADEIVAQAAEHGAGLIVLGSHGHGALYHLFAGSVVTGVLKRAACPVLVVPVRDKERE